MIFVMSVAVAAVTLCDAARAVGGFMRKAAGIGMSL